MTKLKREIERNNSAITTRFCSMQFERKFLCEQSLTRSRRR